MDRFRGGLVCKAHRLVYHSTLGLRVIRKKTNVPGRARVRDDSNKSKSTRKVEVRPPRKGNSDPHGARPVHLIITMIKWIRTGRLSIKNSLSIPVRARVREFARHEELISCKASNQMIFWTLQELTGNNGSSVN